MIKIFGDFGLGMLSFFWGGTPYGPVGGMYYFIVEEVVMVSQFVILVLITSVFEIIITITMYRNISALIGGEIDIVGLSKLV
ncbi:hypothetical protein HYT84_03740 [Candidatus Micrarchaeota archaeon]|nr:hypothetical protein [Candidatus Micrarchaeota archaeon]